MIKLKKNFKKYFKDITYSTICFFQISEFATKSCDASVSD